MTNYKKAEPITIKKQKPWKIIKKQKPWQIIKKSVEKVTFQRPQVQAGLMKPTEIRTQTPDVRLWPAPRTLRLNKKNYIPGGHIIFPTPLIQTPLYCPDWTMDVR